VKDDEDDQTAAPIDTSRTFPALAGPRWPSMPI